MGKLNDMIRRYEHLTHSPKRAGGGGVLERARTYCGHSLVGSIGGMGGMRDLAYGDMAALPRKDRERLAAYKVPRLIEFRDAIPQTGVGKYLRRALRES